MKKLTLTLIDKIKYRHEQKRCYTHREHKGYAINGCCSGLSITDRSINNLQYPCYDCRYED
jgi:hypothetical protein